jgi:hypothetical protein
MVASVLFSIRTFYCSKAENEGGSVQGAGENFRAVVEPPVTILPAATPGPDSANSNIPPL